MHHLRAPCRAIVIAKTREVLRGGRRATVSIEMHNVHPGDPTRVFSFPLRMQPQTG